MMLESLKKILLVEDDPGHAELARHYLIAGINSIQLQIVHSLAEAKNWMSANTPDLIISDLFLIDGNGVDLLRGSLEEMPYPVIIITSHGDEQHAVEAMKSGALDYAVKTAELFRELPHLVQRAWREWNLINSRRELEAAEKKQRLFAEALLNTVAVINSSLDLSEVFSQVLMNLEIFINYDIASIMIIEGEMARIAQIRKKNPDFDIEVHACNLNEFLSIKTIYETGDALQIDDVHECPFWVRIPRHRWIRSYAGLPLKSKKQVIGCLNLYHHQVNQYDREDIPRLQAFADQAAIAIQNAQLYTRVQNLAIKDELTGLYNRRVIFEAGQQEIERAQRTRQPLSILFLDIDEFKKINDQYSYATGDLALETLAKYLKECVRESDLVARFGGDEFTVLLPNTSLDDAVNTAKRIQTITLEHPISSRWGNISIAVSIGVCSLSPQETRIDELLDRVGESLHLAKLNGKNRIFYI